MNTEQIYKAWQTVGADVAGLKWGNFVKALAEQPYEIGSRLAREGKGISEIWGAVNSDEEMAEAQRGYNEVLAEQPAQRTWVGLTEEEVMETWEEIRDGDWAPDFYAAIEAKLKGRNT